MPRDKLSKKEIGNIAAACIFISLGIGATSIIALSFQSIFSDNFISFPILFSVTTLLWALLLFALVLISKPFRIFFLRWFAVSEEGNESIEILNKVLLEQREIKQQLENLRKELKEKEPQRKKQLSDAKP